MRNKWTLIVDISLLQSINRIMFMLKIRFRIYQILRNEGLLIKIDSWGLYYIQQHHYKIKNEIIKTQKHGYLWDKKLIIFVVFHQVSYLIAFYNQSIDYTIHWLLFRIWKNKSRIGYKKRLVYYFSIN